MEKRMVPERVIRMREAWAKGDAARDAGNSEPENIVKYRDISYGEFGVYNLLDLYKPTAEGKYPVIVNIHGGGYFYGDKELYRFYCMHLCEKGFAVVNFNYRLSPEYIFPAALEDINSVFVWIEKNAEKYGLDSSKLFVIGDSAGAQLASHYGALNSNEEFAAMYDLPKHTIKIKGLGLACGMYDVRKRAENDGEGHVFADYLGDLNRVKEPEFDVLGNITGNYPPTFVFSAENDFLLSECQPMYELLKSRGIKTKMSIFGNKEDKEVAHVFHVNMKLAEGEKANEMQVEFFKDLMKNVDR